MTDAPMKYETPFQSLMMGDIVQDGGVVLSTHPYFLTSKGYAVVDNERIPLNPTHQLFVYLDNLQGFSCNRPAYVYNGNTLTGLCEFVLQKLPQAAHVEMRCWNKRPGHYNRTRCGPVFGKDEMEVHIVFRERN